MKKQEQEDKLKARNLPKEHDQEQYVGDMRGDNQRHGKGTLICPEYTYTGFWDNNLRHGQGTATYANGDIYTGEWQWGKKHGHGELIERVKNSVFIEQYKGNFELDEKEGQGTQDLLNGMSYTGSFKRGLFHGKGKLKNDMTNYSYDGVFFKGKPQGLGIENYEDGSYFEGEFHQGYKHGKGTLKINKNNYEYVGDWQFGVQQGYGIETCAPMLSSQMASEKKKMTSKKWSNKRCLYEGEFWNNEKHGVGLELDGTGDFYYGGWVFGRKEGLGFYYSKSSQIWTYSVYKRGLVFKEIETGDKAVPQWKSGYFNVIPKVYINAQAFVDPEFPTETDKYYYLDSDRLSALNIDTTLIQFVQMRHISPQFTVMRYGVKLVHAGRYRCESRVQQES